MDDSLRIDPVFHQLLMVHLRVNKLQGASLPLYPKEKDLMSEDSDAAEGEASLMTRASTL